MPEDEFDSTAVTAELATLHGDGEVFTGRAQPVVLSGEERDEHSATGGDGGDGGDGGQIAGLRWREPGVTGESAEPAGWRGLAVRAAAAVAIAVPAFLIAAFGIAYAAAR
ncbi:MAG TPA: hypothetical protein VF062_18530 [Candidatus Limnocylindrales bacterium]